LPISAEPFRGPNVIFGSGAHEFFRAAAQGAMIATTSKEKQARLPKILEHASGDKRFKILEAHMKKHQFKHDALIEVLHKAQELFGYLEDDLLLFIAYKLKLPASRVYGVATFYHFFTLKPKGKHTCVVCLGTACYVKGAEKVLAAVEARAKIKAGETTPDNELSLLTARCIGACGIAPAVVYDGTVTPRQSAESALEHVKGWIDHGH
jgi:bidirectional [NiFe] hydrogenase diaphorase subunit